jgi:hypothetical protein
MWLEAATADSVDDILGRCVAYAWWVCIETEEPIPDDYLPNFFLREFTNNKSEVELHNVVSQWMVIVYSCTSLSQQTAVMDKSNIVQPQ